MQQLGQCGSDNVAVQLVGNGNIVMIQRGAARLTLVQHHKRQRPPKKDLDLLNPYRCPIGLVGRRDDLDSLTAWLDSPASIAVQCRIGRAGSGKTRLALELCKATETKGWTAGFLAHDELIRFQEGGHVRDWAWPAPTLVVVDYAATSAQPLRKWLEDLADRDPGDHPPLRLLLLERHASRDLGWWADLTLFTGFSTAAVEDLFDPTEPLELTRVSSTDDRRALLESIMAEAAKLTGTPAPPLPAPGTDATFDAAIAQGAIELEPLYLLMAGLTAVQTGVPHVLSLTRTDLAERLAARELDRLAALAEARGIDPTLVQHLTACIGLMSGCTGDQLATLVTEEAASLGHSLLTGPDPVTHLLADTLASDQPDRLDPIRPDLIGEAAILEIFRHHRRPPDRQAAIVTRAYDRAGPETTATVIRTAQDFATGSLEHPSLLWLDCLAGNARDIDQLIAIAEQLPQQSVNLRERAAAIYGRIADILRDASVQEPSLQPHLAAALTNLGAALRDLGRPDNALEPAEEAVAIYRLLAEARPDTFKPDLASALNNLGATLRELGRREKALRAIESAVDIRRELVAARPRVHLPDLASALDNFGVVLSEFGRRPAALQATEEAVKIYRELALPQPDVHLPGLAMALSNLGARLSELGRPKEEALRATEEAVQLYRELAAARPDAHMPGLARALANLGVDLSALGRQENALLVSEKALLVTKEAVEIYRVLAAARPDAFKTDLARALNNLGNRFGALSRPDDALQATEEAVAVYRELEAARPNVFELELALALATRADCLEALDRLDEALASNVEAIKALRPTFLVQPMVAADLMRRLCVQYQERSKALGVALDIPLLFPIAKALQKMQAFSATRGGQP